MKLLKILDNKLEEWFLTYSLVVTVAIIFLQVIMRYIFKSSLSWSEELARYIFLWQIWVGTSYAVKKSKHLRVEIIQSYFSEKNKHKIDMVVLFIWLGFSIFLAFKSAQLTATLFARGQLSPAMRIPMGYAYASVPTGCSLMSIRLIQEICYKVNKVLETKENRLLKIPAKGEEN